MTYLIDTNILVRLIDTQSAHHEIANVVVRQLQPDHQLAVVPQKSLRFIENTFILFSYEPSVFTHWRRLVVAEKRS